MKSDIVDLIGQLAWGHGRPSGVTSYVAISQFALEFSRKFSPWSSKRKSRHSVHQTFMTHTMQAAPITIYEFVHSGDPLATLAKASRWEPVTFAPSVLSHSPERSALTLVTWNVWFEKLEQEARFGGFLDALFADPALPVDVIALQEVTPLFHKWLQENFAIRSEWLLTDCWDRNSLPIRRYGNIFLIRKKWAGNVRGWTTEFPNSKMGRYVELLEICDKEKSMVCIFNRCF